MDERTSIFDTDAFVGAVQDISGMIQENNAAAMAAAEDQRNWTERMWRSQSEFNAEEAAKNREWQEYMSNSAHQREVADLKAAGLNPILSAMGGNGASVTSGATASSNVGSGSKADTDHSGTSALVSILNSFLSAQSSLLNQTMSARSNEAIADKYIAMDELIADINASTSRYVSDNSLKGANASAGAMVYSANKSYETSSMVADANKKLAELNNNHSLTKLEKEHEWEEYMKKTYPDSSWDLINSVLQGFTGESGAGFASAAKDIAAAAVDGVFESLGWKKPTRGDNFGSAGYGFSGTRNSSR